MLTVDNAYQGVQPGNSYDDSQDPRYVRHAYYQWVPFVLFLQGLMFYIPHFLWKTFEGQRLSKIMGNLRGRTMDVPSGVA